MKKVSMVVLAAGCGLIFTASGLAQMSGQPPAESRDQSSVEQSQTQQQKGQQQQAQQGKQQGQDQYVQQIMEPDKFKELKVQDARGEEVGTVDQVILDAKEGRIGYIVVTTGETLGMGGKKAIIPWSAVKFQQPGQAQQQQASQGQQQGKEQKKQEGEGKDPVLVSVSKDQLMAAPDGEIPEALDQKYGSLVHEYYGVSPYWEESQGQQAQGQTPQQPQQRQPAMQPPPEQQQPSPPMPQQPGQQM
jgi:sporulation protein YlmC with PRC-barrel domain